MEVKTRQTKLTNPGENMLRIFVSANNGGGLFLNLVNLVMM